MTFSPDGTKLLAVTLTGIVDVFDFDRCTGQLSNWRELGKDASTTYGPDTYYGCAFSPDGTKVYAFETYNFSAGNRLFQFDLNTATSNADRALVGTLPPGVSGGQLQLGPDGKIYITQRNFLDDNDSANFALSVIHQPNWIGGACQFDYLTIDLKGKQTSLNLPNMPNYNLGPSIAQTAEAGPDRLICFGDSVLLGQAPDSTHRRVGYWWSGPGLGSSQGAQVWAKPDTTSWYQFAAMDSVYGRQCGMTEDSVLVTVATDRDLPAIGTPDTIVCLGDTIGLHASLQPGWDYHWTGGGWIGTPDSARTWATGAGDYALTMANPLGTGSCFLQMDTVAVVNYQHPAGVNPAGRDTVICTGDTVQLGLASASQHVVYGWSGGPLSDLHQAQPLAWPAVSGNFVLLAQDITFAGACALVRDTARVVVEQPFVHAAPEDISFCAGECFQIGVAGVSGYLYAWSPVAWLADPAAPWTKAQPSATMAYTLTVVNPAMQSPHCRERQFVVNAIADACNHQNFIAVNGDAVAEVLDLGDHAGQVHLQVYDVAGRLVFDDHDYRNDWSAAGLAHGVYVYRVTLEGDCPSSFAGKLIILN